MSYWDGPLVQRIKYHIFNGILPVNYGYIGISSFKHTDTHRHWHMLIPACALTRCLILFTRSTTLNSDICPYQILSWSSVTLLNFLDGDSTVGPLCCWLRSKGSGLEESPFGGGIRSSAGLVGSGKEEKYLEQNTN